MLVTGLTITGLFLAQIFFIRPWGAFPINDDWTETLLTLITFKEGHFSSAYIPVSASTVLQSFWALPFAHRFGFSHATMRIANLTAALILLLSLDSILAI